VIERLVNDLFPLSALMAKTNVISDRWESPLARNEVNFANDSISQDKLWSVSQTSLRNRTLLVLSNNCTDALPKPKTTIGHTIQ